jgi:membrane carboxypeptidase/penicillin-binding protein PbpC
VYAAAVGSGQLTLASIVRDEPSVFFTRLGERYLPENYDRQFHGPVPVRVALASSFNVPAVAATDALGVRAVADFARSLGLEVNDDADLSLALGASEVRLLDLTAAYGTLASGGLYRPPRLVLATEPAPPRRAMSAETAWLLTDVLSDDAARAPGFGRDSVLHIPGERVAVKTGTTSDFRDNWTVGYTRDLVVGVWVGNADNRPMRDVSGVTGAAPLWRDVMDAVLVRARRRTEPPPPGLEQVELCAMSARRADPECPAHRLEWLPRSAQLAEAPRTPLRISYPHQGAVITPDAALAVVQQVPIWVEADVPLRQVQVSVDGQPVGTGGRVAWAPKHGRHVLTVVGVSATGAELRSESVTIEVVLSGREPHP